MDEDDDDLDELRDERRGSNGKLVSGTDGPGPQGDVQGDLTMEIERLTTRHAVELRGAGGASRRIGGLAAVFGKDSQNLGGFVERVAPSFFNKSRGDGWPNVVCRWNHSDEHLLGSIRGGTLQLSIDSTGLNYDVDLPECRGDV